MIAQRQPLRIACSGLVAADHGSVSSAGYEILRELLSRGHEIDFFSSRSYVYPQSLIERGGLNYVDCSQPHVDALIALGFRTHVDARGEGRPPALDAGNRGSRMSAQVLVDTYRLSADGVRALPYPIDVGAFTPRPPRSAEAPPELLWVGRVVPRKRLDLFLDAGAMLIRAGWEITLTVVGGFAFARGYENCSTAFRIQSA